MRFAFIMLGALAACPAVAGPQPTATEIFHLRTECMKLGKEMEKERQGKELLVIAFTKYNEKTNRCYVLMKLIFVKQDSTALDLVDGQGSGRIAWWSKNSGEINGDTVSPSVALDYIQNIMKDEMGEKN